MGRVGTWGLAAAFVALALGIGTAGAGSAATASTTLLVQVIGHGTVVLDGRPDQLRQRREAVLRDRQRRDDVARRDAGLGLDVHGLAGRFQRLQRHRRPMLCHAERG